MLEFYTLLALAYSATAAPTSSHLVLHETVSAIPRSWAFHSPSNDHDQIRLQIAVTHPHHDYLDLAAAVSDPSSAQYGQHLNNEQLAAALPDLSAPMAAIEEWLRESSIDEISRNGEYVRFYTTAAKARSLLDADFAWYSAGDRNPVLRTTAYSVPAHLRSSIDFIHPTVHFMQFAKTRTPSHLLEKRLPPANPDCTNSVCPKGIKSYYHIGYEPPNNKSGSRIGVAGFLEESVNVTDVQDFLFKYGLRNASHPFTFTTQIVNNGTDPLITPGTIEATLDVEYAAAFTYPLPLTLISTGGRPPSQSQPGNVTVPDSMSLNEPYLEFLQALIADPSPPQVISISYTDTEQTVPLPYATKVCNLFGQLAARGVSVIVSAGDGGAAGTDDAICEGPNGEARFLPTFPASCPWVTAVGAVNSGLPAYAASYTSGGFSNYFGVPAWQASATAKFQTKVGDEFKPYYNASGRGIPDVAVVGSHFLVYAGGFPGQVSGTSASAPVFAAIVALLNDVRLRAGKPVLGFLNPALYAADMKGAFTDVTMGSAGGCEFPDGNYTSGWNATKGWDATTGLGTPKFHKLRKALV